jgi:hypothetical protein
MKTSDKIFYWTPRAITILAILFVSLFAFDSFSQSNTFWQNAGAFLIHLAPVYFMISLLIIAWKWELVGGIIMTIAAIAWTVFVLMINLQRTGSVGKSILAIIPIALPFLLSGILFIISYYRKKSRQ